MNEFLNELSMTDGHRELVRVYTDELARDPSMDLQTLCRTHKLGPQIVQASFKLFENSAVLLAADKFSRKFVRNPNRVTAWKLRFLTQPLADGHCPPTSFLVSVFQELDLLHDDILDEALAFAKGMRSSYERLHAQSLIPGRPPLIRSYAEDFDFVREVVCQEADHFLSTFSAPQSSVRLASVVKESSSALAADADIDSRWSYVVDHVPGAAYLQPALRHLLSCDASVISELDFEAVAGGSMPRGMGWLQVLSFERATSNIPRTRRALTAASKVLSGSRSKSSLSRAHEFAAAFVDEIFPPPPPPPPAAPAPVVARVPTSPPTVPSSSPRILGGDRKRAMSSHSDDSAIGTLRQLLAQSRISKVSTMDMVSRYYVIEHLISMVTTAHSDLVSGLRSEHSASAEAKGSDFGPWVAQQILSSYMSASEFRLIYWVFSDRTARDYGYACVEWFGRHGQSDAARHITNYPFILRMFEQACATSDRQLNESCLNAKLHSITDQPELLCQLLVQFSNMFDAVSWDFAFDTQLPSAQMTAVTTEEMTIHSQPLEVLPFDEYLANPPNIWEMHMMDAHLHIVGFMEAYRKEHGLQEYEPVPTLHIAECLNVKETFVRRHLKLLSNTWMWPIVKRICLKFSSKTVPLRAARLDTFIAGLDMRNVRDLFVLRLCICEMMRYRNMELALDGCSAVRRDLETVLGMNAVPGAAGGPQLSVMMNASMRMSVVPGEGYAVGRRSSYRVRGKSMMSSEAPALDPVLGKPAEVAATFAVNSILQDMRIGMSGWLEEVQADVVEELKALQRSMAQQRKKTRAATGSFTSMMNVYEYCAECARELSEEQKSVSFSNIASTYSLSVHDVRNAYEFLSVVELREQVQKLFDTFLAARGPKAPDVFNISQFRAFSNALRSIMAGTRLSPTSEWDQDLSELIHVVLPVFRRISDEGSWSEALALGSSLFSSPRTDSMTSLDVVSVSLPSAAPAYPRNNRDPKLKRKRGRKRGGLKVETVGPRKASIASVELPSPAVHAGSSQLCLDVVDMVDVYVEQVADFTRSARRHPSVEDIADAMMLPISDIEALTMLAPHLRKGDPSNFRANFLNVLRDYRETSALPNVQDVISLSSFFFIFLTLDLNDPADMELVRKCLIAMLGSTSIKAGSVLARNIKKEELARRAAEQRRHEQSLMSEHVAADSVSYGSTTDVPDDSMPQADAAFDNLLENILQQEVTLVPSS